MPSPAGLSNKPGLSTAAATLKELSAFLGRYRQTIIAVVTVISPGDVTAVNAAIDAITTFAGLFERLYDTWRE